MQLKCHSNGKAIALGEELGRGGEGTIYLVSENPPLAAKIYHKKKLTQTQGKKLKVMLAKTPANSSIAWPVDLLVSPNGREKIEGFLMPLVKNVGPIHNFYTPMARRKLSPLFNYRDLLETACNFASAVTSLHAKGYVIGDVNESNILVTEKGCVTLVDTDSFQVFDSYNSILHRCQVGKLDFTPPELQGLNFQKVVRSPEQDLFGMSVIIFQLLMEGNHPFDGIYQGRGEPPPRSQRITAGHFPYGSVRVPYKPKPLAPSFRILPLQIQSLFQQTFEDGHQNPGIRPDASTWVRTLKSAKENLVSCKLNDQHRYGRHLTRCPWCEMTKQLGGYDPFPSKEAVAKGEHLPAPKPSASYAKQEPIIIDPILSSSSLNPAFQQSSSLNPMAKTILTITMLLLFLRIGAFGLVVKVIERIIVTRQGEIVSYNPHSLVGTLTEHRDDVNAVLITPDAEIVISGSHDRTIRITNLTTGQVKQILRGHQDHVTSLAITPNSETLVSGSWDKTIKIWHWKTGQQINTLKGHRDQIYALAISPDGQTLASGSDDGTIKVWDLATGELKTTLNGHEDGVLAVTISPDGRALVSGSEDGTVRVWELETGLLENTITGHEGAVKSVAISPDGQKIISGGRDKKIKIWNIKNGRLKLNINGHVGDVTSVTMAPDSKTIISGSGDRTLQVWNAFTGKRLHTLTGHSSYVTSLDLTNDGKTIVSASGFPDKTVKVWDLDSSRKISSRRR